MIVLALDSSADLVAVAVSRDGETLAERTRRARRPRSEGLILVAAEVLADAAITLDEVGLIGVATGPGSFNGIRGGIATAEGLALALGVAAVGVPTLDAIAYPYAGLAVVCALLPAGRGEYYGAVYDGAGTGWRRVREYAVGTMADFVDDLPAGAVLCGAVPAADREATGRYLAQAPAAALFSRAAVVATLAEQRMGVAGFDAAASLRPLYLRRPGITQPHRPLIPVEPISGHRA